MSCPTTSDGRSSARSRRRRASTRSTSGWARTGRSSSGTSTRSWASFTLDFGNSFVTNKPVLPELADAIGRSAKLAGLALLITIPFAIIAGLFAARRRDRPVDRGIVLLGLTSSSIPEFVTGTILVVLVGVQLQVAAGDWRGHRAAPTS